VITVRPAGDADVDALRRIATAAYRHYVARIGRDPVGFQKSATGLDLGFYAVRSYSLMRPPRTGRRLIRSRERSATG
jgi:hypothetical protein